MKKLKLKELTLLAILVTMDVILTRFLSISTPIVRIGFAFIPIVLMGYYFGPVWAGIGAALADILGMLVFPSGAYFPGFTVTQFLTGIVYGLAFYKKEWTWKNILFAVLTVCLIINLCIDTCWLYMLTGNAFSALIIPRILKCAVMIPIQYTFIYLVDNKLIGLLKLQHLANN